MAELLVRTVEIANNLTSDGERVKDSNLVRARSLTHGLDRALDRAFALSRTLGLDLDLTNALNYTRRLTSDLAPISGLVPARGDDLLGGRVLALVLARELDLYLTRAIVFDVTPARARTLGGAVARDLDRDLLRCLDLARDRDLADDLDLRDLARAGDRRGFTSALTLARLLASDLAGALSDSLGIKRLNGLGDALLNGALDDFRQADLSRVDLAHIGLAGVRWSESGTRWPPDLDVEALIQVSEETEPGSGIYVITPRGESEKTGAEARV